MALRLGPTKWGFSQEAAVKVCRWEPETRIHSLQTALSARCQMEAKQDPGGLRPPQGHPEAYPQAIWWLTGRHPDALVITHIWNGLC
jgi:hypothetical protein